MGSKVYWKESCPVVISFSPHYWPGIFKWISNFSMPSSGKVCSPSNVLQFAHGIIYFFPFFSTRENVPPRAFHIIYFGKWLNIKILSISDTYLMHREVCWKFLLFLFLQALYWKKKIKKKSYVYIYMESRKMVLMNLFTGKE